MDPDKAKEVVERFKIDMVDLEPGSVVPERYDHVQPKVDGWWTYDEIRDKIATIVTSGGEVRSRFSVDLPDCDLISEWVHGTNWAQTSPMKELFVVHDIVRFVHEEVDKKDYPFKRELLNALFRNHYRGDGFPFCLIYEEPACNWKTLWQEFVVNQGFEGLIFKSNSPIHRPARMKKIASCNYVVRSTYEGNGRLKGMLGGLVGGLYINGVLAPVCRVGGGFSDVARREYWERRDKLLGCVFEAHGKVLFSSGALRHPNFHSWRPDYPAMDCVKPFTS